MIDTTECFLKGQAFCKVKVGNEEKYVLTHITVPCTYTSDWQCDAHCWHDEGTCDYDMADAYVTYPDEYQEIDFYCEKFVDGNGEITELLEVIKDNLEICDV